MHTENSSPVAVYRNFGNTRPTPERLGRIYDHMISQVDEDETFATHVVAADVCIDRASSGGGDAFTWIDKANEHLDIVADQASYLREREAGKALAVIAVPATLAHLRRAEMPSWTTVLANGRLATNYFVQLSEFIDAASYAKHSSTAFGHLAELVPVLLGTRAKRLGHAATWNGRLSLDREDCQPNWGKKWDIGINFGPKVDNFVQPEQKFQMKAARIGKSRRRAHERADVRVMIAKDFGFTSPWPVIYGCAQELGIGKYGAAYTSGQLDEMTGKLYRFMRPTAQKS